MVRNISLIAIHDLLPRGAPVQKKVAFEALPLSELPEDLGKACQYWRSLLGERSMPSWKQFDLLKIPARLLPFTIIIDIEHSGPVFRYRFYGSGIAHMAGSDLTGLTTSEIRNSPLAEAVGESLTAYLSDPDPHYYQLHSSFYPSSRPIQYGLRLPLADNGEDIDKVVTIVKHNVSAWDYDKALPPREM